MFHSDTLEIIFNRSLYILLGIILWEMFDMWNNRKVRPLVALEVQQRSCCNVSKEPFIAPVWINENEDERVTNVSS